MEIANKVLKSTGNEGKAIAPGIKHARQYFEEHPEEKEDELEDET